jgi:hypothetical protein
MTTKGFLAMAIFFAAVLFSYDTVNAQETTKPAAEPAAKKNRVVVTDPFDKPAPAATESTPAPKSTAQQFGNYSVKVTESVSGQNFENGKWFTVTKWDGTKWVSKRTFFPNKEASKPQ